MQQTFGALDISNYQKCRSVSAQKANDEVKYSGRPCDNKTTSNCNLTKYKRAVHQVDNYPCRLLQIKRDILLSLNMHVIQLQIVILLNIKGFCKGRLGLVRWGYYKNAPD